MSDASDAMSRYRVTGWPSGSVPVPKASRFPSSVGENGVIQLDDTALASESRWGPPPAYDPRVELPSQLYLQAFRRLDTGSPDDIARFVSLWGDFGTPWRDLIPLAWVPWADSTDDPRTIEAFIADRFPEIGQAESAEAQKPEQNNLGSFLPESFRLKAGLLRDAIRVWLAVTGNIGESEFRTSWESKWAHIPTNLDSAMTDFFIPLLNQALTPFSPIVYRPEGDRTAPVGSRYSTYNLVAVQLYNDVMKNTEIHTCENPACRNLFTVQTGRALHGQGRKRGTKYCSSHCSSAISSANYRRRRGAHE